MGQVEGGVSGRPDPRGYKAPRLRRICTQCASTTLTDAGANDLRCYLANRTRAVYVRPRLAAVRTAKSIAISRGDGFAFEATRHTYTKKARALRGRDDLCACPVSLRGSQGWRINWIAIRLIQTANDLARRQIALRKIDCCSADMVSRGQVHGAQVRFHHLILTRCLARRPRKRRPAATYRGLADPGVTPKYVSANAAAECGVVVWLRNPIDPATENPQVDDRIHSTTFGRHAR